MPGRGRVCAEEGGGPASPPRAPGLTEGAKFAGGGGWGGWGGGASAPGMGKLRADLLCINKLRCSFES